MTPYILYQILESISPSWKGSPTHSLTCAKMLPRNKSSNASAHKSACRRPTHEKEVGGTTRLATRTSIQIFKQKCHHILNQILESISPRRTRAPKYMVMCVAVLAWNIEHRQPKKMRACMHPTHEKETVGTTRSATRTFTYARKISCGDKGGTHSSVGGCEDHKYGREATTGLPRTTGRKEGNKVALAPRVVLP
jgi:hypothetical protein